MSNPTEQVELAADNQVDLLYELAHWLNQDERRTQLELQYAVFRPDRKRGLFKAHLAFRRHKEKS